MGVPVTDDAVRERHGCLARRMGESVASHVTLWEGEQFIGLTTEYIMGAHLTPWQARYLASKLYRLARRIRNRQTEADPS